MAEDPIKEEEFEEVKKAYDASLDPTYEKIFDSPPHIIHRRPVPGQTFNEYASRGVFDAPLPVIAKVLGDFEYRKKWDDYAIEIKKLSTAGKSDLLYWSCKFPWPLTNRDYLFWRSERKVDDETVIILMRGTTNDLAPEKKDLVRVQHYTQAVLLRTVSTNPPKTAYFITTAFDLMGSIPKSIQNWAVSKGVPQFISTTNAACHKYQKENPSA